MLNIEETKKLIRSLSPKISFDEMKLGKIIKLILWYGTKPGTKTSVQVIDFTKATNYLIREDLFFQEIQPIIVEKIRYFEEEYDGK